MSSVTDVVYFDTSALAHRYYSGPLSSWVDGIITKAGTQSLTSDITVLEMCHTLAKQANPPSLFEGWIDQFLADVDASVIRLVALTPQVLVDSFYLMRYVRVDVRRSLKSLDSIHIRTARRIAQELGRPIRFITADEKLSMAAGQVHGIMEHLNVEYRAG